MLSNCSLSEEKNDRTSYAELILMFYTEQNYSKWVGEVIVGHKILLVRD